MIRDMTPEHAAWILKRRGIESAIAYADCCADPSVETMRGPAFWREVTNILRAEKAKRERRLA